MDKNKRLFCSKPFTWFEASAADGLESGEVYLCCPAWLDTSVGNLQQQSVEEIWNGAKAQDIRRSILDGSFEYCKWDLCPFLQDVSGPVQYVEDVTDTDLLKIIQQDLTILPYGPKDINCSYDRSCNLSCPSCRLELIVEMKNKENILKIQNKINDEALKDARFLYITGSGDPFGSPFFRRWLQSMKRADMPNLDKIHLHSNGQLWTPKMWETIPAEIRAIVKEAEISIDAANATTYSVNRRGGHFEKLLHNLEFISSLRQEGPLEWLGISMVVQENNFEQMADFVRLGQRFKVDSIYFSQLVNWGTFSNEEFTARAIHMPSHPRHQDFVSSLQHSIFDEREVILGNLTSFRDNIGQPVA